MIKKEKSTVIWIRLASNPYVPVSLSVVAGCDVAGDVPQDPSAVLNDLDAGVAKQGDQEGKGPAHRTDVGLQDKMKRKEKENLIVIMG